jgi:hypothetical protein
MSSKNGNRPGEGAGIPWASFQNTTEYNTASSTATIAARIRAELSGDRRCSALGITVDAYAPVCAIARQLIRAGFPPDRILEVYRGTTLCFCTTLATAARLTVEDSKDGVPRFRWYRPPSWEVTPPIAPTGTALARQPSDEKNALLAATPAEPLQKTLSAGAAHG